MNPEKKLSTMTLDDLRAMIALQLDKHFLVHPAEGRVGRRDSIKEMQTDEKTFRLISDALDRSDVIDALIDRGVTLEEIALTREEVLTVADDLSRRAGARLRRRRRLGIRLTRRSDGESINCSAPVRTKAKTLN
jgi:hypothetical protein